MKPREKIKEQIEENDEQDPKFVWYTDDLKQYNQFINYPSQNDVRCNLEYEFNHHDNFFTHKHFNFPEANPNDLNETLNYNAITSIDHLKVEQQLIKKYNKSVLKLNNNTKITDTQKQIRLKTLLTRHNKAVNNIGKELRSRTCSIQFDTKQSNIILQWIEECLKVYNECIKLFYENRKNNLKMNMKMNMKMKYLKKTIFNRLYKINKSYFNSSIKIDSKYISKNNTHLIAFGKAYKSIKNLSHEIDANIKYSFIIINNANYRQNISLLENCLGINHFLCKLDENDFEKIDICIQLYETHKFMTSETIVNLEKKKNCPYDTLSDELRSFCSNLKSCFTNFKNNGIPFTMKEKKMKKSYSLMIPIISITKKGIFPTYLGETNLNIDVKDVKGDSRLIYDKRENKFSLSYPIYVDVKPKEDKQKTCALDPGESIFQTYYSLDGYGTIGENVRKNILEYEYKIRKLQRIISQGINEFGEKLKNKKSLMKKIRKLYTKIKNLVKELHNQAAIYLCKNFDTILIPEFATQKMLCDKKEIKKKYKETIQDYLERKDKEGLKKYNRQTRLNSRVKFCLNMLSHYRFRQHLICKANEYGCRVLVVTEEYTSQLCTKCGMLSKKYKEREKICTHCGDKIHRDYNGSRNILLKNILEIYS